MLKRGPLEDRENGQCHLSSDVHGIEDCGKRSGAENGGDESGHLDVPWCCRGKPDPEVFQKYFVGRQNGFFHGGVKKVDAQWLRESFLEVFA